MLDLSPLRPWEYPKVDAEEWHEALALRTAWNDGIEDARAEQKPDKK